MSSYSDEHKKNNYLHLLENTPQLWSFLTVKDLLQLSAVSHEISTVLLPSAAITTVLKRTKQDPNMKPSQTLIPLYKLRFPYPVPLLLFRKMLSSLATAQEEEDSVVDFYFDERKSKGQIDLGFINLLSSTNNTTNQDGNQPSLRAPLIYGSTDPDDPAEELNEDNQEIFKHLEKCSMDEYDDFNPRHPMPKDRAHRRGDSYFNSDIDTVVNELGTMTGNSIDLRNSAREALLHDHHTEAAAPGGQKPPVSAKSRILAKTRNNYPGRG